MGSFTYKLTVPRWAQKEQFFFANIFMAYIETQSLSKIVFKPTVWKHYMDDIFSLWDISKPGIVAFFEQANLYYPGLLLNSLPKFTETMFFDPIVYKGTRFNEKAILDVDLECKTHFKQIKRKPLALDIV